MNKTFSVCALFFLLQCGQIDSDSSQGLNIGNDIGTIPLLANEWELLRANGDYIVLRENVENHIVSLRQHGEPISFFAYYYMAHSYQTGPFDLGLSYCDSALAVNTDKSSLYGKCKALKGTLLRKKGSYQESINYLLPLISTVSNDSILFTINRQLSINYRKKNLYDSAIYYNLIAERIAENLENLEFQYYAIQSMANIHSALDESEKALQKEKQLVVIAENLNKKNLILSNTVNLAASYFDLNQADSALYYFEKAKILANELNDLENLSLLYTIYAGHLIDVENYNKAEEIMLRAADLSIQSGRMDYILRSYEYLSYTNIESEDFNEAIKYAKMGIDLAKEMGVSVDLGAFYDLLSTIFKKTGDYQNAYNYSEEYRLVMDSVLNVSKMRTIKALEIQYETEKKSREIEKLNSQSEIQQLEIQQQYWMIGSGLLAFTIVVVILILFYKQRSLKKENEMLSLEQRFLRFQMNPHFIFNALGAIQKFVLTKNPIEGASFIAKFSSLIRQVLEHSREEYIALDKEVESLSNYLELQKLRFEDTFDYFIEVDSDIEQKEVQIPPMFAQPFIENALEHGISTLDKRGKITVTFAKSIDGVQLTIVDNGKGLESLASQAKDHISLATTITNERINKIGSLGNNVNLTIKNIQNDGGNISGVQVSLLLPTK